MKRSDRKRPELSNDGRGNIDLAAWPPAPARPAPDPAVEARIERILAALSLEDKVGQVIQADIGSVTPDDVRTYRLGSIINGGNSAPGGNMSAPPADWLYTRAVWHYARGMAFNAKGQPAEARRELAELEAALKAVPAERSIAFFFRASNLMQLAANVLAGEIAAKAGDYATAERLLRAAVAEQDTHWFTEPPPWYFPVRQSLGAVLLQAGRAAEAEQVYREDLARNPDNGWSLFGLTQALRAQGKTGEATIAETRFRKAWASADVTLAASRF